jgi:hypothetical protein
LSLENDSNALFLKQDIDFNPFHKDILIKIHIY